MVPRKNAPRSSLDRPSIVPRSSLDRPLIETQWFREFFFLSFFNWFLITFLVHFTPISGAKMYQNCSQNLLWFFILFSMPFLITLATFGSALGLKSIIFPYVLQWNLKSHFSTLPTTTERKRPQKGTKRDPQSIQKPLQNNKSKKSSKNTWF